MELSALLGGPPAPGGAGARVPLPGPAGAPHGDIDRVLPGRRDGEDGERGRGHLLQALRRHSVCPAVRRHGLRPPGQPGEHPGPAPAGAVPPGGGGHGARPGHPQLRPGPPGGGGGLHHHRTCSRWTCSPGTGWCSSWGPPPPMCARGAPSGGSWGPPSRRGCPPTSGPPPTAFPLHLSPGDCVLMVSDGVAGTGRTAGSGSGFPNLPGTAPRSWPPTSSPTAPRGHRRPHRPGGARRKAGRMSTRALTPLRS